MLASQFIRIVKDEALQNIASDFYSDYNWVYNINRSLEYIFRAINVKDIRYYTNTYQEIAWLWNKEYTTQYPIQWFITDNDKKYSGVFANNKATVIDRKNFYVYDNEWDYFTVKWNQTGITGIVTSQEYDQVEIYYKRWPIPLEVGFDPTTEIDLPEELLWVLQSFVMWRVMPTYLENGASLSNFYFTQWSTDLNNYIENIGQWIDQDWFYTE